MRKKNVLVMGLSMALVAVISIGGTLAFLTDSDTKAVNTFKFANNLEVSLSEELPTEGLGNATAGARADGTKGVVYENVVVNQLLPKEPKIQLTQATVDTYVFAKIDNNTNDLVEVGTINSAWTSLGPDSKGDQIYGRLVTVRAGETQVNDTATALFSNVTIKGQPATGQDLGSITIYVSAIQAEGFEESSGKTAMQNALAAVTTWEATTTPAG